MEWKWFVLVSMIFLHIVDDFYMQGLLGSLKQKKWWEENYPDTKYKQDYWVALFLHSFSWAFMIMLVPTLIVAKWLPILFICNILMHMYVDNEKANKFTLNLWQDQLIHLIQIVVSWYVLMW